MVSREPNRRIRKSQPKSAAYHARPGTFQAHAKDFVQVVWDRPQHAMLAVINSRLHNDYPLYRTDASLPPGVHLRSRSGCGKLSRFFAVLAAGPDSCPRWKHLLHGSGDRGRHRAGTFSYKNHFELPHCNSCYLIRRFFSGALYALGVRTGPRRRMPGQIHTVMEASIIPEATTTRFAHRRKLPYRNECFRKTGPRAL